MKVFIPSIFTLLVLLTIGQIALSEDRPTHKSRLIVEYSRSMDNKPVYIFDIAPAPDGKSIAVALGLYGKGAVELRDENTGKLLWSGDHPNGHASTVIFSPDGACVATAGRNRRGKIRGEVRVWEVKSGKLLRTLYVHTGNVYSAAFSPDNRTIAVGSGDGRIRFWDCRTDKIIGITSVGGFVNSVSFSPNRALLAFASWNQGRSYGGFWDIKAGKVSGLLPDKDAPFYAVSFSPDSGKIATAAPLNVYGVAKRNLLWAKDLDFDFQPSWDIRKGSVGFSSDGGLLVVSGSEGAGLYRASDGTQTREFKRVESLVISAKNEIYGVEYEGSNRGSFLKVVELDDIENADSALKTTESNTDSGDAP